MDWTEAGWLNPSVISSITSAAELDTFVSNENSLRAYLRPFTNYSEFAQQSFASGTSSPFAWHQKITIRETPIQITGVNTAWSSRYGFLVDNTSDERHLLLAQAQIDESDEQANGSPYRLLLMHHPFDWFNPEICARQETRITRQFDVVLSGHVHSARSLRLVVVPGSQSCMIPSPLLYGWDYEDSTEFARALVVADINIDTSELSCRYYKYSETFGPKLIPYLEIYPPEQDHFSTSLKPPTSAPRRETGGVGNILSKALTLARENNPESVNDGIESFHQILQALNASGDLVLPQVEPRILSLMILIGDSVISCGASGYEKHADHSHIAIVENCRRFIEEYSDLSSDARSAISHVISFVRLDNLSFADLLELPDPVTGLVTAVIWGIAEMALLVSRPSLIPAPGNMPSFDDQSSSNIIRVENDRHTGRLILQVKTATRDEFHRLAECRHAIQQYFSELEDLWRQAGLVPRPIRFDLGYPLWSRRMIESYNFQVDARPITNLLMGKALYGDQKDVWIRELVQHAIDAVTMRERLSNLPEESHIEFKLLDAHTVTITDNGVGMDGEHIVYYLATLGRSGWRTIEKRQSGDEDTDPQSFYGRFGIGFASVFSAATEIELSGLSQWVTVFAWCRGDRSCWRGYCGGMRYPDGGGLTAAGRARREKVRLQAAEWFAEGVTPPEVARRLRVSCNSAYAWRRRWRDGGLAALASRGPGGAACRLSGAQLERLRAALEAGPAVWGWAEDQRWTLERVAAVIGRLFHVRRYTLRGTSFLLHRMGFSPQVPVHRAAERDEDAIAAWRAVTWAKVRG